jgi:tetratricopeptide (TPR) repeat protein
MARSIAAQNPWASYAAMGTVEYYEGDGLAAALEQYMLGYGEDPHDELSNRALIKILSQAGLFEEARRISDGNLQIVDIAENQLEGAITLLQRDHAADPENIPIMVDLADALHLAGRYEESQRYYTQIRSLSPLEMIFDTFYTSTIPTVRMAYAYKLAGDSAAAEKALANHRRDIQKRTELGLLYFSDPMAEALASAVEDDPASVFEHLRQAMVQGARDNQIFREPAFSSLQNHPEFLSLKAEMDDLVMQEQAKILTLVCHHNPIPDIWQPLSSTCVGVQAGP